MEIVLRALAGGLFVVVFSLVGEVVRPKGFAGIFAAAPSVALASLALTARTKGLVVAGADAGGMIVGAIALTGCCLVCVALVPRLRALRSSLAGIVVWALLAGVLFAAVLR